MFSRSLIAAASLALLTAPAALLASTRKYDPVTVTIEVRDLDPAKAADRATFELRLKNAARAACDSGMKDRWAKAEEQRCIEEVITGGAGWAN
ncbi:MAG: UrcA family protein [Novosphingobium sp.]|uniref:UrcA family protein n=1 Tax=Novosphingobium sp. TaxID=1874826 RepID=UPI003C7B847F